MTKKAKPSAGRRRRTSEDRLELLFLMLPGRLPQDQAPLTIAKRHQEVYEDLVIRLSNVWQRCRKHSSYRDRKRVIGLHLNVEFLENPRRWTVDEGHQLLNELESRAEPIFLGSDEQPRPIDLPFARVKLRLDLDPGASLPELAPSEAADGAQQRVAEQESSGTTAVEKLLAEATQRSDTPILKDKIKEPQGGVLSSPESAYNKFLKDMVAEEQEHKQGLARRFEPVLNAYLQTQAPENAEQKRKLVERVSADLKGLGLAVHHPATDQPCTLMVASGKAHSSGQFLLMPKGSKRALVPRANLLDLLPLQLMPETPRREPLAEWRKRLRREGDQISEQTR